MLGQLQEKCTICIVMAFTLIRSGAIIAAFLKCEDAMSQQELDAVTRELNIFKYSANIGLQAAFPTEEAYLVFKAAAKAGRAAESDIFGERCAFDWNASPALRAEFVDPEIFIAFKRAEAQGRIGIVRSGAVTFTRPIAKGA